jgi:hypothetical protein|tara:strand:- start:4709 stop:5785 length:1077 start_codon:yes stop_codon:yes gene_type:complete
VIELISDPKKISPDWLTQVLANADILTTGRVIKADGEVIGTGKMGDNVRFSLSYDGDYNAPATIIAKLPAMDETARTMASLMGAYRKEVMFYSELASHCEIATPTIYLALIDDSGADFIILMEDLAPAEPGSQLIGETAERAKLAVAEAAKLHASFYNKQALLKKDYITHTDEDSAAFGQQLLQQNWPGFVERFGHGLNAECIAFGSEYVLNHVNWSCHYTGPKTLIHADFRTENLLFGVNGATTTVDWQTLTESCGLADVAYFLGGSLETEDRRQCEQDTLDHYRHCLANAGFTINAEQCWQQYREFSVHGLMITVLGAMFSAAEERSDKMFLVMAQRHLQHCVDMKANEFFKPINN